MPLEGDLELENLLYKQLQDMAKQMNIKAFEKLRKKDLIEVIKKKQKRQSKQS